MKLSTPKKQPFLSLVTYILFFSFRIPDNQQSGTQLDSDLMNIESDDLVPKCNSNDIRKAMDDGLMEVDENGGRPTFVIE